MEGFFWGDGLFGRKKGLGRWLVEIGCLGAGGGGGLRVSGMKPALSPRAVQQASVPKCLGCCSFDCEGPAS